MLSQRRIAILILVSLAAAVSAGCGNHSPASGRQHGTDDELKSISTPRKLQVAHLPNAYRIHEKVISGGQPDGAAAFKELKDLGVKTIISVDGAKPEVELARKYGLKYVHLPHGYDGISQQRAQELAKAVRDLEGDIYIHCHHGKHRSPAAAAVACVSSGLIEPSASLGVLKAAGTSENYRGLYKSAESAEKLDDALLDALNAEFPETTKIPPLAEAMVALEHTHDHMKQIAAAGWTMPPAHPDIDPPHEALLLREHFTEMLRSDAVQSEPEGFQELMRQGETAAKELEDAFADWKEARFAAPVPEAIPAALDRVTKNCAACHQQYRDVPLGEKRPAR